MRVCAIEAGLRPAQQLDALDVVERDVGEVVLAVRDRIRRHAVDHDQEMIRLGAAHAELRERATRAGLADRDAGKGAHRVGKLREAARADFLAGHHGDRRAGLGCFDRNEARRDDEQLGQEGLRVRHAAKRGDKRAGREAGYSVKQDGIDMTCSQKRVEHVAEARLRPVGLALRKTVHPSAPRRFQHVTAAETAPSARPVHRKGDWRRQVS